MYNGNRVFHIVATDKNLCIGKDNEIPWKCKADLEKFKELTMGKVCVVGRKTFESLPASKLPGRFLLVVSSDHNYDVSQWANVRNYPFVSEALDEADQWINDCNYPPEIIIIGGATIYEHTIPIVDTVYHSKIDTVVSNGDTFYPLFSLLEHRPEAIILSKEYATDHDTD